ncbi:uncharacterized protein LOC105664434 [Ceratitis capitata]|uniref:Uncharacterized protein n=1 Tax=Ceratitis capitata TaxID=7213 RepID=W8ARJ7_CERCA|nr:uncharacterized protein LOC105664434 [Ceratitis capitata]
MSKSRFYNFPGTVSNGLTEEDIHDIISNNNNNEEDNEDNDDDSEFLRDVPYSSSSIDRSSIGSIPWADDAIKQNQLDWEKVERMLSGEDELPDEPDLRNEIEEWQTKFPQLMRTKTSLNTSQEIITEEIFDSSKQSDNQIPNPTDDLVSHLSFNSSDDDDQYDELPTPTAAVSQRTENLSGHIVSSKSPISKSYADRLSAKMALLRIAALPIHQNPRHKVSKTMIPQQTSTVREHSSTTNSLRLRKISPNRPQPLKQTPKQPKDTFFETQQRFHMPPILNVLETKRRFRDLASNKSFVQLTRVKPSHAKSAAIIRQTESSIPVGIQPRATALLGGHQSVWHKPLIATRVSSNFFNNRNAIILPALNTQRISAQQRRNSTTTSTGADTRTQSLSNSNLGSSESSSAGIDLRPHFVADRFVSRWQHINPKHTSTSTGTVSTGRSISAAVHHHSRSDAAFGELYMPFNTHKHGGFQ